ncbi:MAG: HAD-IA family hydrolase, partial [Spirochaetales bacterium]|nr:HAD-IA family hydrolase [Spirochaetales bacterium]
YPLDEKFVKPFLSISEERKKLGVKDIFTILLSFGGEGIGSYAILEEILRQDLPIQILVLCGRNKEAVKNVKEIARKAHSTHILPYGFVSNMQDFMYCCDISAGKAGMNTTFESIYMRRPFMVTKSLINERVNVALIKKYNFGWVPASAAEFVEIVKLAVNKPETLTLLRKNMEAVPYELSSDILAADIFNRFQARKRLPQVKTLFFDLAGTLCDIPIGNIWELVNAKGFEKVLEAIGYPEKADASAAGILTDRFIKRKTQLRKEAKSTLKEFYLGAQLRDFFLEQMQHDTLLRECLSNYDLNGKAVLEQFDLLYMQPELDITKPFDKAAESLKKLASRYDLYLLSNNASTKLVECLVDKMKIRSYFKKVFISSEIGWRKPHRNFAAPILKLLNINPLEIAMIGDRLTQDIRMANENGMLAIYISAAEHEDNHGIDDIHFDYEIKSLHGLVSLLT